jgi:hypothetical protein
VAQALTAATLVNVWATRPLLAGLLYRKGAATTARVEILTSVRSRRRHRGLRAMAAQPAVAGNARDKRDARQFRWAHDADRPDLGRARQLTPLVQGERLHTLIRGSTLETIADVGYIPHIEDERSVAPCESRPALISGRRARDRRRGPASQSRASRAAKRHERRQPARPDAGRKYARLSSSPRDGLVERLRAELKAAEASGRRVAVGAARHSMGGQSLPRDGVAITFDNPWFEINTAGKTYRVWRARGGGT